MGLRDVADLYAGAVRDMATLPGTVQSRLLHACVHYLRYIGIEQDDVPDALWDIHYEICAQANGSIPDGTPYPLKVRFSMMGDSEAADMARRFVDLADRLRAACQAPPWHYVGAPTAVIRVLSETSGSDPSIRDPGVN
jgi:hypothetical protein